MVLRVAFILVALFLGSSQAYADKCNVDCNKKCCKTIKITPWDKNTICEPGCKSSCEAAKVLCRNTPKEIRPDLNGPLGDLLPPNILVEMERVMLAYCAAGFEVINKAVILSQGHYSQGSYMLIEQAKTLLITHGFFSQEEFANVSIRWARLTHTGQAPDRNVVLLDEDYLNNNDLYGTATTLGHEMIHIRQYRRMGTDNFKCEYSKKILACKGCQNERHPLEKEAYDWGTANDGRIAEIIQSQGGTVMLPQGSPGPRPLLVPPPGAAPPPPMPPPMPLPAYTNVCVTAAGACSFVSPLQRGLPCQCVFPMGVAQGTMQ